MILRPINAALLATLLAAVPVYAQAPSTTSPGTATAPGVTILAEPYGVRLRFSGSLSMTGRSPLELPPVATGRFSLLAQGEGVARTQGAFRIAGAGNHAELLSEPPGMSMGLLVRSLNYPGFPDFSARQAQRGAILTLAGTGAIFGAARSHFRYRDRLDEFGDYANDRTLDERRARDYWLKYGAAVWGVSALDYMIRPRFSVRETSPSSLTLRVPSTTRTGSLWRSLLVPGAGQEFAGHRFRGSVWLSAALAAGAGLIVSNVEVDHNQTKTDWAEALVDSAGPSERPGRLRELAVLRNQLQESQDARRGMAIAIMGIWVANLIDAAVMTVSPVPETQPGRLRASFPISPEGPAVAIRYKF